MNMCKCVNIAMGSYQNQTCINPPFPVDRSVISGPTGIDNCLLEEILSLWERGIVTWESCCGHNVAPAYIMVKDQFIPDMVALGYVQWEGDPTMFYPKSVSLMDTKKPLAEITLSAEYMKKLKDVHDDLEVIRDKIEAHFAKKPSRWKRLIATDGRHWMERHPWDKKELPLWKRLFKKSK